ncbi:MAG: DUF1565 domain-containing protein [Deltaproteobacteria bacterium]|nr:DUF1565 domain-containing protein [Deltaproteobacteria bacterium]
MKNLYFPFMFLLLTALTGCDPATTITSPQWGDEFEEGAAITFSCNAQDLEDGPLSADTLVWTSNVDGKIGTGTPLVVDSLSPGLHIIALTATDSDSNESSDEIEIIVGLASSTTTTITADITAAYYISPDGNDADPGTEDAPWQTVGKAADTLTAGQMVYIKTGTYSEQITPENSGSTGKFITYAAYPGDTPVIDGTAISLSDEEGLFHLSKKQFIKISGLKIANAGPNDNNCGILVESSDHIIIENNHTYNTVASGIGVWGSSDITIDGNEVELACNDGEQECITVAGTDTFTIMNNHVHDGGPGTNGGEGIDVKDGSSNGEVYGNYVHHTKAERTGIYVDSWDKHTFNIDVYRNIVHDCGAGISLASENGGLLENIRIYNNILYQNRSNGIEIGNWGEPLVLRRPVEEIDIFNNTVYENGSAKWGGGLHIENPDSKTIVIRNNIFSQNVSFQLSDEAKLSGANLTADHNLIDGFRKYGDELYGDDYVEGGALFADPAKGDFHLLEGSAAIDSGSSQNAPADDYDGHARPSGTRYDIGAFEFTESEN